MYTQNIATIRKELGLTQKQLATKAGLTREGIAQIETGRRKPYLETFIKIADALGVTLDELARKNK